MDGYRGSCGVRMMKLDRASLPACVPGSAGDSAAGLLKLAIVGSSETAQVPSSGVTSIRRLAMALADSPGFFTWAAACISSYSLDGLAQVPLSARVCRTLNRPGKDRAQRQKSPQPWTVAISTVNRSPSSKRALRYMLTVFVPFLFAGDAGLLSGKCRLRHLLVLLRAGGLPLRTKPGRRRAGGDR